MLNNRDEVKPWPSRVPPGVPGAGRVIAIVYACVVIVLSHWWWQDSHGTSHGTTTASAPASHHARASQ